MCNRNWVIGYQIESCLIPVCERALLPLFVSTVQAHTSHNSETVTDTPPFVSSCTSTSLSTLIRDLNNLLVPDEMAGLYPKAYQLQVKHSNL
jgi:hypothetical protein